MEEHENLGKAVWQWPSMEKASQSRNVALNRIGLKVLSAGLPMLSASPPLQGTQSETTMGEHRIDFNVVPAKALMDIFLRKATWAG